MIKSQRVWFITGVSGGLGRALAKEVALSGDIVIGTLRKQAQVAEFDALVPEQTFGVLLDVNNHLTFQRVLNTATLNFGSIDILVNNAGYGLFGAIEEVSMDEARQQMETNFFGALALTQAVLPLMRERKSGHIIQISSMAGFRSLAGMGLYNASKFALEGFSEALALETKHLNIKITIVEPGPFRTNWAGDSSIRSEKVIEEYSPTAGSRISTIQAYSGNQPGDPEKAARAIIKVVNSENPPLRLPLGTVAIQAIRNKLKSVEEEINEWEKIAADTSFDD
ncbi:oxidoreductase [Pedobacter sp. P351]|uniref:oxidoreductase n=1 Tax=Pedobacter superstes TaxID=3133441 RepID=UPI003096D80D